MRTTPALVKEAMGNRDLSNLNPRHAGEHLDSLSRQPGGKQLGRKAAVQYLATVYARFLAEDKVDGSSFDVAVLDALKSLEAKAFEKESGDGSPPNSDSNPV